MVQRALPEVPPPETADCPGRLCNQPGARLAKRSKVFSPLCLPRKCDQIKQGACRSNGRRDEHECKKGQRMIPKRRRDLFGQPDNDKDRSPP